jgi:hypothetical protein
MAGEAEFGGLVLFLVELARAGLEVVAVLIPLGPVDDVDAEVGEADVDLIQLVRKADHLLGEDLVDLVVKEVPLLFPQLDQLLDRGVLLFDGRQARNGQCSLPIQLEDMAGAPRDGQSAGKRSTRVWPGPPVQAAAQAFFLFHQAVEARPILVALRLRDFARQLARPLQLPAAVQFFEGLQEPDPARSNTPF